MPFGIDVDKLQAAFDNDFNQLRERLDQLIALEQQILDELRKKGSPQ